MNKIFRLSVFLIISFSMVPSLSAQDELQRKSEKMMLPTEEKIEDDKELEELEEQLKEIKVRIKKVQKRRRQLQKKLVVHNKRIAAVNKVRRQKVEKCLEGMESYNGADVKEKAISALEIELMHLKKNNGDLFSEDPAIVEKK